MKKGWFYYARWIFYTMVSLTSFGIFVTIISRSWLNYEGYCLAPIVGRMHDEEYLRVGKRLTDAEVKRAAMRSFYKGTDVSFDNVRSNHEDARFEQIPYESDEEFLNANPDCCHIVSFVPPEPDTTFDYKTSGLLRAAVAVEWLSHYYDEHGHRSTHKTKQIRVVENCGSVWYPYLPYH